MIRDSAERAGIRKGAGPLRFRAVRTLPLLLLLSVQPAVARSWGEEKCDRYARAWSEVLQRRGSAGLSPEFLGSHAAFLNSGCRERSVCPRSREEIAVADLLTVLAVNAGLAGTFLPFICRR